jgi:hypothetical protein
MGMSKLEGGLAGKLTGDAVLVALQAPAGRQRWVVSIPAAEADPMIEYPPISGGSDADLTTGSGVTGDLPVLPASGPPIGHRR